LTRCGRQHLYHYRGRSASWLANGGLHTKLLHGDPRPDSDGYLYQRRRRKHPGAERATRRHRSSEARFHLPHQRSNSFTTTVSCTCACGRYGSSVRLTRVPAGSPYAIGEDAPPAGWRTVGCLPGSVTVIPGQTATVTAYQRRRRSTRCEKELQGGTAPSEGSLPPSASSGPNSFTATVSCTCLGRYGMQRYG